ncbi:hypothetical protein [Streptomyces sp. NPDC003247]|uniref:hypothetical protein n=1 Tax=Streptomyces sp. NPDC003247 TaxID=3364677 RepID=UPI003695ED34
MRATGTAAVVSPLATALPTGTMPWQAELALALSGPLLYGLHHYWTYRLSRRALDCVAGDDVVDVVAYGTGQPPPARGGASRRRTR